MHVFTYLISFYKIMNYCARESYLRKVHRKYFGITYISITIDALMFCSIVYNYHNFNFIQGKAN